MNLTDIFLKLLSMSLMASYCVLFICIARLCLRRMPKVFSYLLWSIVAVRLLCPISFKSNFSLIGERLLAFTDRIEADLSGGMVSDSFAELLPTSQSHPFLDQPSENSTIVSSTNPEDALLSPGNQTTGNYTVNNSIIGNINNTIRNLIAQNGEVIGSSSGHLILNYNIGNHNADVPGSTPADEEHALPTPATFVFTHQTLQSVATSAARVWFTGMLGLFGYCILSCLRLHRNLAKKAAYSCHYKDIPVYEVTGLDTPFATGFPQPAIYLPARLEEWEACQCLAHEYTHIRRKDYLIKQFAFLLTCVYWFQPLVWLAFHLMTRDMEMSCDEMTLRNADLKDRKAYSNALVRLSTETHRISGFPLAFSENNTSSRIKNILNLKKPTGRTLIVCSCFLVVFAAGLLANPSGNSVKAGNSTDLTAGTDGSSGNSIDSASFTGSLSGTGDLKGISPHADISHTDASGNIRENEQSFIPASKPSGSFSDTPAEDPYRTCVQDACQELQIAYQDSNLERAAELQQEMKQAMTSYWSELVGEHEAMQNELKRILNSNTGLDGSNESADAMLNQLYLLESMTAQAKAEMNYVERTIDAIIGSVNVVKTADYATNFPLYGTLSENDVAVRSMPKESAPHIDTLDAGEAVSIISFGKYMLQEDIGLKDFFFSDAEIQQEYQNFAVVLYQSKEDNGKTTRKGYINIDVLEISGNTAETYMYWIGKTWSEAFCSQDGATLYQMAADTNSFMDWDYINIIRDTDPVQVEFNLSRSYPQHYYQVNLLTGNAHEGLTASGTDDLALQFFVQTSEPGIWTQRQDLKVSSTSRQLQNIRCIDDLLNHTVYFSEIRNYKQITSYSEYQDAFLTACESGPCYFDFKGSGYAALYCPHNSAGSTMPSYTSDALEVLLEKYLNLSGGNGNTHILALKVRDNGLITGLIQLAYVEYTFAGTDENGQNMITIPMYHDEGCWYIWVPGQDEAMDETIYEALEDFPVKSFE